MSYKKILTVKKKALLNKSKGLKIKIYYKIKKFLPNRL
jgi:hypothetical protein